MVVPLFIFLLRKSERGGILSPILFCVYIGGSDIGHVSYSVVGYADDVGLLTPSVQALQALLRIYETLSEEFRVVFN